MCISTRLSSDVSEIKLAFGIPPDRPTPNIAPSRNLAPTDPAPAVYYDAKDGDRRLEVMRWGLIPYWAKDIKVGFANINAKRRASRASRLSAKPLNASAALCRSTTFSNGRRRRPVNSLTRSRSLIGIMALAGLWENWHSPAGEWVRTFAIFTTTPNELCAKLRNRMPVALKPEVWPAWLGEQPATVRDLNAMLAPTLSTA
jgi:putative SOS response-associated peptidase YedK